MRIGQRGTQTRLWARKGTRPRVVRQQQSEPAYIFGAVCPRQDSAIGLVMPHANTEAMVHHRQALSEAVPAGRHATPCWCWCWTGRDGIQRPNCRSSRTFHCCRCQRGRPSSTRPSRCGRNCATGTWPTDATTATSRLLTPAATPGMPSRKSLAPSALCAPAAGQCCLRLRLFHDTGLV